MEAHAAAGSRSSKPLHFGVNNKARPHRTSASPAEANFRETCTAGPRPGRGLVEAEPMVTAFRSGTTAGLFVLAVLVAVRGVQGFLAVLHTGWPGLIHAVLTGTAAPAFVLATTRTCVANVVFILASSPVFAAVFSRIFLDVKHPSGFFGQGHVATAPGMAPGLPEVARSDLAWRDDVRSCRCSERQSCSHATC